MHKELGSKKRGEKKKREDAFSHELISICSIWAGEGINNSEHSKIYHLPSDKPSAHTHICVPYVCQCVPESCSHHILTFE